VDTKVNNTQINTKQYIDGRVASIPIVDASSFVNISGNQNIYGTKYFNSSPTVPNPTSGTHAANKAYVDSKTSSGSYTQSLGSNGWTKLPNGLIIQWGKCGEGINTLPTTFPNAFFSINATLTPAYDVDAGNTINIMSRSSFAYQLGNLKNVNQAYYIAIGY
jgi:hypothetical protein